MEQPPLLHHRDASGETKSPTQYCLSSSVSLGSPWWAPTYAASLGSQTPRCVSGTGLISCARDTFYSGGTSWGLFIHLPGITMLRVWLHPEYTRINCINFNPHPLKGMIPQDPASLGEEAAVLIRWSLLQLFNSREVLLLRYFLLPHLYTLFALQTLTGSTVARPVWHEFPQDSFALGLDTQFLLGSSLMVCPVLKEALTSRECYFPKGIWYEGFDLRSRPGNSDIFWCIGALGAAQC